ncbi:MAG: hypothetical protein P4N59_11320 [Negativicutes bacterium]|nr:hypothetical protein [Negativicutes bacterium]
MADILSWVKSEWFSVVQTVGVVGGLIFTGITIGRDAKAKEVANALAFAERHRQFWSEAIERPELHRVFVENADLGKEPMTAAVEIFLNLAFVQYETGWLIAKKIDSSDLKPLKSDVRKFFALPLPHAAWEKNSDCHHPRFVRFVARAIDAGGPLTQAGH